MADKIAVATCAAKAADAKSAGDCFTKALGGDGAKVAACATSEKDKMVSCLLGDNPELLDQSSHPIDVCAVSPGWPRRPIRKTGAFQAFTEIRDSGHRNGQLEGFCLFTHATDTLGKSDGRYCRKSDFKKTRSTVTVITAQSGCEVTIRSWVGKLQSTYARAVAGQ